MMNKSSDRRRCRPPVTLSSHSTSLRKTNASSTNSVQITALNNQQVARVSSTIPSRTALLQEKDSFEKSSTIPQAPHATSFVKQEAHEDVEETTKFTLFPKLPLELRHKIWVMSFESKEVGIDILLRWDTYLGAVKHLSDPQVLRQPKHIFPVSLRVNTESRAETMRHYSFVSLSDAFEELPSLSKFCLNLGLDCIFVSKPLCGTSLPNMYQRWLDYLDSTGKGGLAKLKHLEVKHFSWGYRDSTLAHRYEVENEQLRPGTTDAAILPLLKFILRLTGLQVLCLTWHISSVGRKAPQQLWKLDESRAMMQEFLGRYKDIFVGGRSPEVQIRYWDEESEFYVYRAPKAMNAIQGA